MRKIRETLHLALGAKLPYRKIATSLGIGYGSVAEVVKRATAAGLGWPLPDDLDDAQLEARLYPTPCHDGLSRAMPDFEYVHDELHKTGVTKWLLWEEYRSEHTTGIGYSQFCSLYRTWKVHLDVVMRQERKAGEKLFTDYSGKTIPIWHPSKDEVLFEAQLFVAALGASSLCFATATRTQGLFDWIEAHVRAFAYFGGVTKILVPDNLRSAVTKADRYEASINRTFEEMAGHYGTCVIPARARKPRDKATAEASVLLCQRWVIAVLRKRRFTSIAELNEAIAECIEKINDKPFKKLCGSRRTKFVQIDRPELLPLPASAYEAGVFETHKPGIDYHVLVNQHYYSVPFQLVGKPLEVRISARLVEVFNKSVRVGSHLRSYAKDHGYTTEPAHMPESHRRHAEWTPERVRRWAGEVGCETEQFVKELLERRRHPEHGYRSVMGLISLAKHHGNERVEKATKRARALGSYSYKSVKSMLENNLEDSPLPSRDRNRHHRPHENVRGSAYYR